MSLTGVPLLVLSAVFAVGAAVGLVLVWRRAGIAGRVAGVLLVEALTVVTAGLVVNRDEQFYPSWQALRGDTGTPVVTQRVTAGRLDDRLPPGPIAWKPAGMTAWRLAGPPVVTLPADYRYRPGVTFPVVLAVGTAGPPTPEVVIVNIRPTARTTASALRTLPGKLRHDLRVTTTGWAVVGGGALGNRLVATGLAARDRSPADLPPALAAPLRLPAS